MRLAQARDGKRSQRGDVTLKGDDRAIRVFTDELKRRRGQQADPQQPRFPVNVNTRG
jgi:hypothetical protein